MTVLYNLYKRELFDILLFDLEYQSFRGGESGHDPWTYGAPRGFVWGSGKCPA